MSDKKPDDELISQTIAGRYRIISRLGAGGMGVAYRAWDEEDGVPVVIKIPKKAFFDDPKFAERFAREIRLLQGLRHPHIVPIVDVGEHEGLPYVAMRFLPGGSLANRRLRDEDGKTRPNPPGMLHLWLPAVADALDHVHSNGIVHRDVKPANIFFDAFWNAFLGDFGIAKIVEESESFDREHTLTATNMGIGTQEYMGPEQFTPKPLLDGRTDQYALAVMAYEMLAGTRPFTGTTAHLIVEVTTMPVPRLDRAVRGLPPSLIEAVYRGLAKNPQERFSTCREFAYHVLRDVPLLADEPDIARLLCPKCSNILKLPVNAAGQKGKCPRCQTLMKVADDLGALWLLDEARRQRRSAASVVDIEEDEDGLEAGSSASGSEIDEGDLEAFNPVSSTTPIERASRKQSKKSSTGMILGSVAAAVLALGGLWMVGGGGKPKPVPQPTYEQKLAKAEAKLRRSPNYKAANDLLARPPIENSIGMKLKLIPPGTFMMGSNDGEPDEKPVHEVWITKPFYLGVTEVTNAQWKAVMGTVPTKRKDDNAPVEQVSWDDAMKFCEKLSALPAEKAAGRVYRLPTEAEWEYACRGGTKTKFSFGDDDATLGDFAWFSVNAGNQTHAVGRKKANPWGLHDMHGNVWEWCSDWYAPYGAEEASDPEGPPTGSVRVSRGGGWGVSARDCRSAYRSWDEPSNSDFMGVRVAVSPTVSSLLGSGTNSKPSGELVSPALGGDPAAAELAPKHEGNLSAHKPEELLSLPSLKNSIGIELKLIPSGTFQMGSNDGEANEKPIHEVRITKPFYLGVTEVTNAQWKAVMGSVRSRWTEDERPAEHVSWVDALDFCKKLSETPAEKSAGRVYRLPTEAEWEYACRAGTTTRYSFGDDAARLNDYGWFDGNSGGQTRPVGEKKPNPWGLYDMHGNVHEWCFDWLGQYPSEAVEDPQGATTSNRRVFRGGNWMNDARPARSAYRYGFSDGHRHEYLGFRLALSPSETTSPRADRKLWRTTSQDEPKVFRRDSNTSWTELQPKGTRYRFTQTAETPDYVELRCAAGRNLHIRLRASGSDLQLNDGEWRRWHAGNWFTEPELPAWAIPNGQEVDAPEAATPGR